MNKYVRKLLFVCIVTNFFFLSLSCVQAPDTDPPTITLINPSPGYFHFSGIQLFKTRFSVLGDTIGLGGFRLRPVQVEVTDSVDEPSDLIVLLFIDGDLERPMLYNEEKGVFEGQWIGPGLGTFSMNISAINSRGSIAHLDLDVWYFCFIPER